MTLLIWERTLSFSSVDEVTMEKVPARSPYKPRFCLSAACLVFVWEADLSERLAKHNLVTFGDEVSDSEGVPLNVT